MHNLNLMDIHDMNYLMDIHDLNDLMNIHDLIKSNEYT